MSLQERARSRATHIPFAPDQVSVATVSPYHGNGKGGPDLQALLAEAGLAIPIALVEKPPVITFSALGDHETFPRRVERLAPDHGRSVETGPEPSDNKPGQVVYGQLFLSESYKGNVLESPDLSIVDNLPGNLIYWGLLDGDLAERMVRTGLFFLDHRIDAELVIGVSKLEKIPCTIEGERKEPSADELKDVLIKKAIAKNKVAGEKGEKFDIEALRQRLKEVDFVVIRRLLPIGERIADLTAPETKEEFDEFLGNIFAGINKHEQWKAQMDKAYLPRELSADDPDIMLTYFMRLAENCGKNLGRAHNAGVLLVNGVASNWSAKGDIVDLESPVGALEGDQELVVEQMEKEGKTLTDCMRRISENYYLENRRRG